LAAHGLSFEGHATAEQEKNIESTAWAITDVRSADSKIPLGVVALPPRTKSSKPYDRALHVFKGLKVDVFDDLPGVVNWSTGILADLKK